MINNFPLVTIITPVYNQAQYLEETIQSILNQDYPNIEYIVLDDGSTDNVVEILEKYTGKIKWQSHKNMGQPLTLNKGWDMAKGEYLGYLSSDDILYSGAISDLVKILHGNSNVAVVYPNYNLIDPYSKVIKKSIARRFDYEDLVVGQECYIGPGALFRKEQYQKIGGWKAGLKLAPDREFWMRMGKHGDFFMLEQVLAGYRMHPVSISFYEKDPAVTFEYIKVLDDFFSNSSDIATSILKRKNEAYSNAWLIVARNYLRAFRIKEGFLTYRKAISIYPKNNSLKTIVGLIRTSISKPIRQLIWKFSNLAKKKSDMNQPTYVRIQTRYLWMPIIFFQLYLNLSVFFFAFGPWPWPVTNPEELYIYLLTAHVILFVGYYGGLKKSIKYCKANNYPLRENKTINWFRISLFLNLLLLLLTSYSRSGSWIPDVLAGLSAPGEAYAAAVQRSMNDKGATILIEYIRIILAPLLALSFPFTVATWRSRATFEKSACVAIVLFNIAIYISMATNKLIIDTVLLIPWLISLGIISGQLIFSKKGKLSLLLLSVTALSGAFLFFGYGQTQRAGAVASGRQFGPPIFIQSDPDNWMISFLPETYQIYAESVLRYLCQGYYALSRALLLDFDSTWGVGHSIFLTKNAESILGLTNLVEKTYPAKLEYLEGWGRLALWDSIYPWIASDVGFYGTLIIVFFIGRYFACSWIYSIFYRDKLSIVLFSYLVMMLFYFPANNQLMQNGESCTGFFITLFLWLVCKRKFQKPRDK